MQAYSSRTFSNLSFVDHSLLHFSLGLDRSYIGQIERCEKGATIDTIGKLADALNVELVMLLNEDKQ